MDPSPTIAIVGRPNVGKSTLFNRLVGKRHAVVAHEAGTTRDRISQTIHLNDFSVMLVDTGGIESGEQENIEADVQAQAKIAIQEADLIIFVVDISHELTVDDFSAANILRKSHKPILLVANKCDNKELENNIYNFYELGFGTALEVSAIHKSGIEVLKGETIKLLKKLKFKSAKKTTKKTESTNICILGKPNAGKSSLVNALLGREQIIVSDIPGTTRDSIDTELTHDGHHYTLIDTAGLRRPGRTKAGVEKFSALRVEKSIERSDIVVLLIDGEKNVSSQDTHIAERALDAKKGFIIAINKIDLFEKGEEQREKVIRRLYRKFSFVPWAPIIFVSAKNKRNTYEILKQADIIMEERAKRVSTGHFNSFMQRITHKHMPAGTRIKKPKFMYATQVDTCPPKFVMHFKNASNLHFTYPRYLENEIRKEFGFNGTAIEIKFKGQGEAE